MDDYVFQRLKNTQNIADFFSLLWLRSKYSHPEELLHFIKQYRRLWVLVIFEEASHGVAISSYIPSTNRKPTGFLTWQIASGVPNAVTLADQLRQFSRITNLDGRLTYYLFPTKIQRPYPLAKFLVYVQCSTQQ